MSRQILLVLTALLIAAVAVPVLAQESEEEGPITVLGVVSARDLRQYSDYVEIDIRNWAYNPDIVEVKPGTVLVWVQQDSEPHNVRFYPSENNPLETSVRGPLLRRGERWAVIINEPGVYEYLCDPHDFMYGVVRVISE